MRRGVEIDAIVLKGLAKLRLIWVWATVVLSAISPWFLYAEPIDITPEQPQFRELPPASLNDARAFGQWLTSQPSDFATSVKSYSLPLTLVEAIGLALDDNLGLKTAYLSRVSQKLALAAAEDKFVPTLSIEGTAGLNNDDSDSKTTTKVNQTETVTRSDTRVDAKNATVGPVAQWLLPTGAMITMDWMLDIQKANTRSDGRSHQDSDGKSFNLAITQPLLKGAGFEVNTASIRLARISNASQIFSLKSTVENTIVSAITDYRVVIQSEQSVVIAMEALKSSRQNLSNNEALVAAGNLPRTDLVQYQTQIRQQEISLEQAQTALDNALRNLALTLGQSLDLAVEPVYTMDNDLDKIDISFDQALNVALMNRSDYQQALLAVESAKIGLMLAKNDLKWDLSLAAGYTISNNDSRITDRFTGVPVSRSTTDSQQESWSINLNLLVPLFDQQQRKRAVANARVALAQANWALLDTKRSIILVVRNVITTLDSLWEQLQLSRQALILSNKQYDIAEEKLRYGRASSFEVITRDNDLQSSKVQLLNSQIDYLNAITALDLALGTTLNTWNIDIKEY